MKKYLHILVIPLLLLACVPRTKKSNGGVEDGGQRCRGIVTVTIDPQRFFVERLAGDLLQVNTLVPPGTSPETYEPAPSVMIEMGKSDIYFMVGDLGFEKAWSERLSANNPKMAIVDCSIGIDRMKGIDHSHGDTDHHDPGHSASVSVEEAHSHGEIDPHVWSSPKAVKVLVKNMLDAMAKTYPEEKDQFQSNYEDLISLVDSVDAQIRRLLARAPSRSFIIYHPALGYFARDYGLHQYSIEFEGKSPSPSQIKDLVDLARKENITTVFVQKGFDVKNAEVLANEIGAEVFEIDPLRYEWDEELIGIASKLARITE